MAKGSDFERQVCRILSRWWTQGERDDIFWRSAGSGAMAKTRSKAGFKTYGQYGDIIASDPIGEPLLQAFTIEMKRGYSGSTIFEMLDKPDSAARQFWEKCYSQVRQDQQNAGSLGWMIIHKRDRREATVYFPSSLASQIIPKPMGAPHLRGSVRSKGGDLIRTFCMRLDDFQQVVSPKSIRALVESRRQIL